MKQSENQMGTKAIFPLLMGMSVPPMISMLIQSLYNIVDSIFVAKLGEEALTAVSLAYPLQNLVLAVAGRTWCSNECSDCKKSWSQKKVRRQMMRRHIGACTDRYSFDSFYLLGIIFYKTNFCRCSQIIRLCWNGPVSILIL